MAGSGGFAQLVRAGLPSGTLESQLLDALPGKVPLLKHSFRPPNYETPELLLARRKPVLQRSLQSTSARSFGAVPFSGPASLPIWLSFPSRRK